MQVATLYYRRLYGHPHGAHGDVDPISAPWGELVEQIPRHQINFDAECSWERDDQLFYESFPVEDSEKRPVVSIVDMPAQWPVIRQAQVGRAILTLVDDGSW